MASRHARSYVLQGRTSLLAGWTMRETSSFCTSQMATERMWFSLHVLLQSVAMQVTHKFAMSKC